MSSRTLYRLSGIGLLIGSLLGLGETILSTFLFPGNNQTSQQTLSATFLIVASLSLVWALLLSMSLPGLYLRQAAHAGMLGFVGFVLTLLGVLLGGVAFAAIQVSIFPYLARFVPTSFGPGSHPPIVAFLLVIIGPVLLRDIGATLLGIATIRARVFPRGAGILLLIVGILGLISLLIPSAIGGIIEPIRDVASFLAVGWFGFALVARMKEPISAPELSALATQPSR